MPLFKRPEPMTELEVRQAEAQRNVASIEAVPLDQLPKGEARTHMIWLALQHHKIRAYETVGGWMIWHEKEGDTGKDCRMTPAEWAERNHHPLLWPDEAEQGATA